MRGTKPEECDRRKIEEKRPLNGKKRNESFETNLDRSKGCKGARTEMTRRTLRAKVDAKEGQSTRREGRHRTLRQNETPEGGKAGLNRPWDPML